MVVVTESVRIAASPSAVWRVLVDVARWPEWTSTMIEVTPLDTGRLVVGERVRVRQPRLPVTVYAVDEIVEGVRFSWASGPRRARGRATHEVVPVDEHTTEVTLGITQSGLVAPVGWLLSGMTRRYIATEAAGLKARCEGAAS